jgi:hypothetical protein
VPHEGQKRATPGIEPPQFTQNTIVGRNESSRERESVQEFKREFKRELAYTTERSSERVEKRGNE